MNTAADSRPTPPSKNIGSTSPSTGRYPGNPEPAHSEGIHMQSVPFRLSFVMAILIPVCACVPEAEEGSDPLSVLSSPVSSADGATVPIFADDFNRSGSLGSQWTTVGAVTANGTAAVLTSSQSYATWTGLPPENTTVSLSLSAPTMTWLGVFTRASMAQPDRNHYAAFVSSNGVISLARRVDWGYSFLAQKTAGFPSGTHTLGLTASGSSPVQLSVLVDGIEAIRYDDDAATALNGAGRAGFFDFNGTSQAVDNFAIAYGVHFSDDFNRSGALGTNWANLEGSFTGNGTKAVSAATRSYAAWVGTANNPVVKLTLTTPIASTYVGVFTRGQATDPHKDHYAAFVDPSGIIKLRRRNNSTYTSLATGPSFPSGTHVIGISTACANPVQITVTLDGETVIEYDDSSGSALTSGLKVGVFDYNGSAQAIDDFTVAQGANVSDDFNRTGSLGAEWTVGSGSFTLNGSRAEAAAGNSYAFAGASTLDSTAIVEMDYAWLMQAFSGVTLRATNGTQTHYAGGINANGNVHISRRSGGTYATLATGSAFPTGVHTVSLTAMGTDPVQLSLKIDNVEWLHFNDSSTSRLTTAGQAGIFVSQIGSGQFFGKFWYLWNPDLLLAPRAPDLGYIPPQQAYVGRLFTLHVQASDRNPTDTLSYSATSLPAGATISTAPGGVGVFSWTPTASQIGPQNPTFIVTDSTGKSDSQSVAFTVSAECSPISHFENAVPAPSPTKFFYIDGVNGDDQRSGPYTETWALRTIQKGLDLAKNTTTGGPGSAVIILPKAGGYSEPASIADLAGTATAPIWVGGKYGSEPIISGTTGEVMKFVRPQYVVVHNMIIGRTQGRTASHGINIDDGGSHDSYVAHHVILRNLAFLNIGDGSFIQNCVKISGVNDFHILNSSFSSCGTGTGGGDGIDSVGCHDGFIVGNSHTGRKFVQAKGGSRNIEIRRNTSTYVQGGGGELQHSYSLGGDTSIGSCNNFTTDCFRPSLGGSGDGGLHYEGRHIRLIGNLIQAGPELSTGSGRGIRLEGCYQCLVANNTVIDPIDRMLYVNQASQSAESTDPAKRVNTYVEQGRVYNNIFYFSQTPLKKAQVNLSTWLTQARWDTFVFYSNLYCNRNDLASCAPLATNLPASVADNGALSGTGADPQFAFLTGDGYPLKATSPAKNSGTSLTLGSPSPLNSTGSTATSVEDHRGVCFASTPSRGAREVP